MLAFLVCDALAMAWAIRPNEFIQLLMLFGILAFLYALAHSFITARELFLKPFREIRIRVWCTALGLAIFLSIRPVAKAISQHEFDIRRTAMESVLAQAPTSTELLTSAKGEVAIPRELAGFVIAITIKRTSPEQAEAYFLYGGGFPVRHAFWYYNAEGRPPTSGAYRRVDPHWYHVSD